MNFQMPDHSRKVAHRFPPISCVMQQVSDRQCRAASEFISLAVSGSIRSGWPNSIGRGQIGLVRACL